MGGGWKKLLELWFTVPDQDRRRDHDRGIGSFQAIPGAWASPDTFDHSDLEQLIIYITYDVDF
jgi:hypothetical protein